VLEAGNGRQARALRRAPFGLRELDPRLHLQPRVLHAIDALMWLSSHRYRRVEGFACFQHTEAEHQQLAHRSHDNLHIAERAAGVLFFLFTELRVGNNLLVMIRAETVSSQRRALWRLSVQAG
jgi:hypothetical protein